MTHSRRGTELDARTALDPKHLRLFWEKVDTSAGPDSCWPWTAATASNGYGVYGVAFKKTDGKWRNYQHKAHRIAWSLTNGIIPAGMVVRHSCDNPPCCNPAHLLLGTDDDNVADKVARGRQARGLRHSAVMRKVIARGERNGNAVLTEAAVREMREARALGVGIAELTFRFGVSMPTAYRVATRRSWRHVTDAHVQA